MLAIVAGSDTTSSVLTAIIYYLLLNPAVYERLQEEVDGAFLRGEDPLDAVKLSQLEWLNGCMWVLRHEESSQCLIFVVPTATKVSVFSLLFQVGRSAQWTRARVPKYSASCKWSPSYMWSPDQVLTRILLLNNNCRVIPEWTQINLHTYSIHRDARYFHTPDEFLPERWFSKGAPAGEHNMAAFLPYSYGPTMCAGKNLAQMEMRMVLCWILRQFRFSRAPGVVYEEWEGKIQDWFVVHQEPLLVSVSLRE
jgi:cytochrome P450